MRVQPSRAPPTEERPTALQTRALQPFPRRRPPAGARAAGAAPRRRALLSRPARPAASLAARRSAPLPSPPFVGRPSGPPGVGFPFALAPSRPAPGPSPPPPAPMYVSPRAVPARPPTFPLLQRGLSELRTRAALLKSLSQHPRRPASDTGARGLRAPFSVPSLGRPGLRNPDAAAAATARGDLRTGRRQEEECAAPSQSVSACARRDPGFLAPGDPAASPSIWD